MAESQDPAAGAKGRRRGGPLRISRTQILDAARGLDPQTMTMQAVADELGVDRKAINYHVTDREGLLRLVAADLYESHFGDAFNKKLKTEDQSAPGHWKGAIRAWAIAVRDSFVAAGVLANYYRIDDGNIAIFEPVEVVLRRMIDAGFDRTTASRGLISLNRLAMGIGRDIVMEKQHGEHPQGPEIRRLLTAEDAEHEYEVFRWLIEADFNGTDDIASQFDFEVELFIEGMELRLGRP